MAMRRAALFSQSRGAQLLIAPPPLADGQRAGGEEACGRLDATLLDGFDQPQTMVVSVPFHLTHQIEIASGSGHSAAILAARRRPALPPAGRPSPSASSDSHISTPPGGNDVPFQFQSQPEVERGEAEDVHSLIVDRCQPTVGNELSQSSSARRQIRPLCRVSRDPWICPQSLSCADLVTSRHRGADETCKCRVFRGRNDFTNTEGTDHPDCRSRPARHILRYRTSQDFVLPWQVGGPTRSALDRLPSCSLLGSRRGSLRLLCQIEPARAFCAFGGYRNITLVCAGRRVDPGGCPDTASGPFPFYPFPAPGPRPHLSAP